MIRKIVVVFKTHFDFGFTGLPDEVMRLYSGEMFSAVRRVMEVWAIWAPAYKIDAELTPLQRCAVLNLMFEVQRREQEYWQIELPPCDPEKR